MALQLGNEFFEEIGLNGVPEQKKQELMGQFLEVLQQRVGGRLAEDLSEDQLDEFEQTIGSADDAGTAAEEWLKRNNPHYETVIAQELERLKSELRINLDIVTQ